MDGLIRLSILASYGVRWSRDALARDLLQNFYDAVPDFTSVEICVDRAARTVVVRGPTTFDIGLLSYVGATTKKDGRSVGGFGEGFKICALVGVRDFALTIRAGSADWELEVLLDPVPLGQELCYRVTSHSPRRSSSHVTLSICDDAVLAAMEGARNHFRHPAHPALLRCLTSNPNALSAVFQGTARAEGQLFYRRQRRGSLRFWGNSEPALTFVHDPVVDALEGDRDRRDVPADTLVHAVGMALSPEDLFNVMQALQFNWQHGGTAVGALLRAMIDRGLTYSWPAGWLAAERDDFGLGAMAERQGFRLALAAFAQVGMRRASNHYSGDLELRAPTALQRARIQVLVQLHADLTHSEARKKAFKVFTLAGAAVQGQHLGESIIVAEDLVDRGFDACAGTILHELAHEKGGEESSGFLDELARLLHQVLSRKELVQGAREAFDRATAQDAPPGGEGASDDAPGPQEPDDDAELEDVHAGVPCWLILPPGMDDGHLRGGLLQAVRNTGITASVHTLRVGSDLGAARHAVAALPCVRVGTMHGHDQAPFRAVIEPARLLLDVPRWEAELRAAQAAGLVGSHGLHTLRHQHWDWMEEHGFLERERPVLDARLLRRDKVLGRLDKWLFERSGYQDLWSTALHHACVLCVQERLDGPLTEEEIAAEVQTLMERALALARGLRTADPDLDDASAFERGAMAAAQAAAVLTAVRAPEKTVEAFQAVRGLAARLMDLPLFVDLRQAVLQAALILAGVEAYREPVPYDPAAFASGAEAAIRWALAQQANAEGQGALGSSYSLAFSLPGELRPPEPAVPRMDPAAERRDHARRMAEVAFTSTQESGGTLEDAARAGLAAWQQHAGEDE